MSAIYFQMVQKKQLYYLDILERERESKSGKILPPLNLSERSTDIHCTTLSTTP